MNISVSFGSFPEVKEKAEGFASGSGGGWSILVIFPHSFSYILFKRRGTMGPQRIKK